MRVTTISLLTSQVLLILRKPLRLNKRNWTQRPYLLSKLVLMGGGLIILSMVDGMLRRLPTKSSKLYEITSLLL